MKHYYFDSDLWPAAPIRFIDAVTYPIGIEGASTRVLAYQAARHFTALVGGMVGCGRNSLIQYVFRRYGCVTYIFQNGQVLIGGRARSIRSN